MASGTECKVYAQRRGVLVLQAGDVAVDEMRGPFKMDQADLGAGMAGDGEERVWRAPPVVARQRESLRVLCVSAVDVLLDRTLY